MGQKVNPHGLRVGVIKDWDSKWYAEADFADFLVEDYNIRTYLKNGMILSNEMYQRLEAEGISHRTAEKTRLSIGVICRRVMNRWYWSLPNAVGEGKEPENAVSLNAGDVPWKTR